MTSRNNDLQSVIDLYSIRNSCDVLYYSDLKSNLLQTKFEFEPWSPKSRMGAALIVQAAADGDASKVEMLLSQGARVDARDQGFTPLLIAALRGHTEVCKLLLETGKANVKETNPSGHTALLVAALRGHSEVCELLLAAGSDVEENKPVTQSRPLHYAAIHGHERIIQMLVEHKTNVNSRNKIESTRDGHAPVFGDALS